MRLITRDMAETRLSIDWGYTYRMNHDNIQVAQQSFVIFQGGWFTKGSSDNLRPECQTATSQLT
jgi:hypothetical protein